ncbi:MAG TPA: hypothetical protein VN634_12700 [Candidatus Limnocylindrales bacterium]|nr:hypothetical protein [Candidatus Limnocylindrales bacterium]
MTDSYALFDCGRTAGNGRFSALRPRACPPGAFPLAKIELDIRDVAKLGGFGLWRERWQCGHVEEQTGAAIADDPLEAILDRWIHEHAGTEGVALDETQALGQEAEKLLGVLVEDSSAQISAAVSRKLAQIVDYLEQLNTFWAATLSALVDASKSDDAWRVVQRPPREIAREIVAKGMDDASYDKSGWWFGAIAENSLLLPVVGPILRRASAGWLITHLQDRRQHRQLMKRLTDHTELVSLYVAKNQLLVISTMLTRFLTEQRLGSQASLYATRVCDGQSEVLLGPTRAPRWYARPFARRWEMRLRPLAASTGA